MARVGSFSPSTFIPGAPLAVVHPADNNFPQYDPEVAALNDVTEADRVKLQQQIDELTAALSLSRDYRS